MYIPLRLTFTSIQGVEYELGILLEPYMFAARAQKTQELEAGLCLKVIPMLHFLYMSRELVVRGSCMEEWRRLVKLCVGNGCVEVLRAPGVVRRMTHWE